MLSTVWGIVRDGKIELAEPTVLEEGAKVLITALPNVEESDNDFWMRASETSLAAIWDNPEDDVYAELLKE